MPLATASVRSLSDPEPASEPAAWLVVFHVKTCKPWLDRLIPGRFKHVSAVGYVDAARTWAVFDFGIGAPPLRLATGDRGRDLAASHMAGASVLRVAAPVPLDRPALPRFGLWCVAAVKHLIGSGSGALRPDRLWRDLVANGAEVIVDDVQISCPDRPDS